MASIFTPRINNSLMVGRTIPSTGIRQIYSMGVTELVTSIKSAASKQIDLPKYWDALLYRSSVLSDQFTPSHISSLLNSFTVFPKYNSTLFFKFLLDKHFPIPPQTGASVSDLTMIMHAIEKLSILSPIESSQFWYQHISPILSEDKIKPTLSGTDLYRVSKMACRYEDKRIQEIITSTISNSFDKHICTPQLATLMFELFVPRSPMIDDDDETEPFFTPNSWESVNYSFLTKLLNKSISFSPQWNPRDIVTFATGFSRIPQSSLALLGHPNSVAIENLLHRRIQSSLVQFKISQLVTLINIVHNPEPVVNELIYRIRELNPKNCIKLLEKTNQNFDAIFTRLLKHDTRLTDSELLVLVKVVARCPDSQKGRQVVANQLSNLKSADLIEWLLILGNLNVKFDVKKIEKLVRRNKREMMEKIGKRNIGSVALALAKLGIFDHELIFKFDMPEEVDKLVTAVAIMDLTGPESEFALRHAETISRWVSLVENPSTLVRLLMLKLGSPIEYPELVESFKMLNNVIFCPISANVILIHVESFARWLEDERQIGQSLIRQFSDICPNEFVALQLIDPDRDFFIPLLDEQPGQLNTTALAQDKFVRSQFVTLKSFNVSGTTDLIDHTIHDLASIDL